MPDKSDFDFFDLRKEGKIFISKVFSFNAKNAERLRQVRMVLENSDSIQLGEIEGALCLRLTGNIRKTQVTALITQDEKNIKRLSLQTFKTFGSDRVQSVEKNEFTFRSDEFERLIEFLNNMEFINLSNVDNFQVEDFSTSQGPKAIIDASDRGLIEKIKNMSRDNRSTLFASLTADLSEEEVNLILGRRQGLELFEKHFANSDWSEGQWQNFFEKEQWVFGYGLDYRFMRLFDREMVVGGVGTSNKNKPVVDYLMTFTDYTVLVEIKRPDTKIFKPSKNARSGTWEFSSEFIGAVSQILEQKAEWLSFANHGEHSNKTGTEILKARTKNAKSILVIGSNNEFSGSINPVESNLKKDTFELFRRGTNNVDIITFDELLERAKFITKS